MYLFLGTNTLSSLIITAIYEGILDQRKSGWVLSSFCLFFFWLQMVQTQLQVWKEGEGAWRSSGHGAVHSQQHDGQHVRPHRKGQAPLRFWQAQGPCHREEEGRCGVFFGHLARPIRRPLGFSGAAIRGNGRRHAGATRCRDNRGEEEQDERVSERKTAQIIRHQVMHLIGVRGEHVFSGQ